MAARIPRGPGVAVAVMDSLPTCQVPSETIGRYVHALDRLHRMHAEDDALRDKIHWL